MFGKAGKATRQMKKGISRVQRWARDLFVMCSLVGLCFFCGCHLLGEESGKVKDLDMVVLSEERIPKELMELIEERKSQPFQLTYKDENFIYICVGYGEQETGGYSIAVDDFYLSKKSVCVKTTLLGPDGKKGDHPVPSCPYLVIRTEKINKPVTFG